MAHLTLALLLVVRIYDAGMLSPPDRAAAVEVAAGILSAASVPTTWPDCGPPRPAPKPSSRGAFLCARPVLDAELAVRIVRDPLPPAATRVPLGYSLIDRSRGGGTLATLYLNRIERLASESSTPVPVLLGRAMAHEIGHLLLGDDSHAARGVMRAIWSSRMLRSSRADDWLFTADQSAALRHAMGMHGAE